MGIKFRSLRADEVDCRVSTVSDKGCSLLLYKDARCDQNILDETVGCLNWQRHHTRDNANCIVSIWDDDKKQWIEKEDTGTESYTEKEKGLASDSFKRACFNFGIGRELYTAPFIWIKTGDVTLVDKGGKKSTYDKFEVSKMEVKDGRITALEIVNVNLNKTVFTWGTKKSKKVDDTPVSDEDADAKQVAEIEKSFIDEKKVKALNDKALADGVELSTIYAKCHVKKLSEITMKQFMWILANWTAEFKDAK